jgi:DNA repair protein RadA/Sms
VRSGCGEQGRDLAIAIDSIALFDFVPQLMNVDVDPGALELFFSPMDPRSNRRRQEDLYVGVGQYHRADVAPRHHDRRFVGNLTLGLHHHLAHFRMSGHRRHDCGYFVRLQEVVVKLARSGKDSKSQGRALIERYANWLELQEPPECGTVVRIRPRMQCDKSERPIHGARIEIQESQLARDPARNRRLSRCGGPIDRNLQGVLLVHERELLVPTLTSPQVAKARSVYFCSACGFEAQRWLGRCPQCEAWNSFDERPFTVSPSRSRSSRASSGRTIEPVALSSINDQRLSRLRVGMNEFDSVLGGGIVPGSLTLVGGPPGAGKSTLLLQVAARLAQHGEVVYVCGEESAAQVKLRAQRLRDVSAVLGQQGDAKLLIFPETNLRAVLDALSSRAPAALIVDSIQTVWLPETESYAGSIGQIRDCTQSLMEYAKRTGCAAFIVGHVTKDGAIAGPRLLEHLVDTVLYFEGETSGEYRILRAYKNRFGSIDEICVFSMHDDGLNEVPNPSDVFLGSRAQRPSGSCVVASIVGSRPVLVELQALVGEAAYGTPRRLANNLDQQRLAMILAVLERRAGFHLGTHDVYASVAGGLQVSEPAADLGIALAIASSFRNVAVPPNAAVFGEIGLSGELRAVNGTERREMEARKQGYSTIVSPSTARDISEAIAQLLH